MNFVIYTADCTGNKANCDYPHRVEVDGPEVLQEAVKKDHVCAEYKGNYRSKINMTIFNKWDMNSAWKRRCLNSFDEIRFISEIEKKR